MLAREPRGDERQVAFAERLESDPRARRYWELVAVLRGGPPSPHADAYGWLIEGLRRRLGRIDFRETGRTVSRVTIASLVLAGVSYALWLGVHNALGASFAAALVGLVIALAGGLGTYLVSCRLLGVRELEPLLSLRRRDRNA